MKVCTTRLLTSYLTKYLHIVMLDTQYFLYVLKWAIFCSLSLFQIVTITCDSTLLTWLWPLNFGPSAISDEKGQWFLLKICWSKIYTCTRVNYLPFQVFCVLFAFVEVYCKLQQCEHWPNVNTWAPCQISEYLHLACLRVVCICWSVLQTALNYLS